LSRIRSGCAFEGLSSLEVTSAKKCQPLNTIRDIGCFPDIVHDKISISALAVSSRCPVRYYLDGNRELPVSYRYAVCKQLSYHLGYKLDPDLIWEEICAVHPEIPPGFKDFLDVCIKNSSNTGWRQYRDADVQVFSNRYGIYGMADKVFASPPYFSVVRSTSHPAAGIFPSDRLRSACYALCLEEILGVPVEEGIVEYIPSGVSRTFRMQPRDRRSVLSALRTVSRLRDGSVPEKPVNARCEGCPARARCSAGLKTLSDIM
jgi:CRISPR-associated exonuclease Cas4